MNKTENLIFDYIDRDEAIFLLGVLKNIECEFCPDFFKGCAGSYTKQELVTTPLQKYLEKQKEGTEKFLCGKLRNMYLMNEAQIVDIKNAFNEMINEKVGFLTKQGKVSLNSLNIENKVKEVEDRFQTKINSILFQANTTIENMQTTISMLQEKLNATETQLKNLAKGR